MFKNHRLRHFGGLVAVLAMVAVYAGAVWALWDCIAHQALGLPPLNYWQALGLLVLCRALFGGIGGAWGGRGGFGFGHHNRFREKWHNMTEEERKCFCERLHGRCDCKDNSHCECGKHSDCECKDNSSCKCGKHSDKNQNEEVANA